MASSNHDHARLSALLKLDRYQALLFDCDGTIADSMLQHLEAWNIALAKQGGRITEEENQFYAGKPTHRIVAQLNEKHGWSIDPDPVSKAKEEAFLERIPTITPIGDVLEVIQAFHGQIPMAVVSGGARESVLRTLKHLGLKEILPVVIGAEDYKHGKPAPDCFLQAAEALKIKPSACLVFEDADLGIQGAKAAGMGYLRVTREGFDLKSSVY